ncbi:MAG: hypothetical protein AAF152_10445 [Cyanobacteria bacterium P01_A01_bin.114]
MVSRAIANQANKKNGPQLWTWVAVAGLAWGLGYVYNVHLGGEARWLKDMYQRKIALAQSIDQPKILVTGGSGAHYTLNSAVIEQQTGRPVVNLGLDGPVGLDVILPSILDEVEPGDTVVLVPEYLILLDDDGFAERSGPFSIAIGRPGLGGIPARQLAQDWLMIGVPSLRGAVKSAMDLVEQGKLTGYYDDPLTPQGDPTVEKERTGEWWQQTIKSPVSQHSLRRIRQFKDEVEARGGTLLLSLPWVYAHDSGETLDNVQRTAEALSEIAPLLYEADNFNIQTDVSLFADTHYHLTAEARTLRSQQLADQLQEVLPAP